ncbi:aldo/keto reductase [Belliella kenyensis]|uniref:Aldo/keto reductase n=1 Tax=Belliella kenyensis TaxID=1472724 RepID=A0ABV8EKZ8_9BACT|nr:aldo/keto reductase [Belliella kenyensis]MCH7400306.1 aldo/keto reductase [Belliella kenyensis]MDN3604676.1 aldo/keto reductase [Belliella kenyensis]
MQYRKLGKSNLNISEVSLGTWQVGGGWGGQFDHQMAHQILHKALDEGVNFLDTADVYDGGLSEAAVGKVIRERSERVYVATKCGRFINPHVNEGYTPTALRKYVEASLKNLGLETIDLIQLHCPPAAVYQRDEIFELFDILKKEGKIQNLGVSVELVDEAKAAIKYENVTSVQIIFNMFRHKPAKEFFPLAKEKNIGIIARVPLASGLLTGKLTATSSFDPEDHRSFNREGAAFDKGETFSGVPFDIGLEAVDALKEIFKGNEPLAQWALRWVLMFPEVSTVIPGASKTEQLISNIQASRLPSISTQMMEAVNAVYQQYIQKEVEHQW